MKHYRTDKKRKYITVILLILFLLSAVVISNLYYVQLIHNLVRNTTTSNIMELSVNKAQYLDEEIRFEIQGVHSLADAIGDLKDISAAKELAGEYQHTYGADAVWIKSAEQDTWCTSDHPDPYPARQEEELFGPALRGEEGSSEVYIGYMGKKQILFYAPVYQGDTVAGAVYAAFPVSSLQNSYGGTTYNDAGFSYVLDAGGEIVLSANRFAYLQFYSNFGALLKEAGNSEETVRQFLEALNSGARGNAILTFEGEKQFLCFSPLTQKQNWYFVTVIPLNMVEADGRTIISWTVTMISILIGLIMAAAAAIVVTIVFRNKKEIENQHFIQEVYQAISQNIDTAIFIVDKKKRHIDAVFENTAEILGIAPDDFYEVDAAHENPAYHKIVDIIYREQPLARQEWEFECFNSALKQNQWLVITGKPVMLGNTEKLIFTAADTTNEHKVREQLRVTAELAEEANRSKSTFLSNMSHDIRTPMNAIIGFSTLLERDAENPEKVREYTKKITSSGQHLLGLINDVLDMSKIEAGKTTLNMSEENVAEIVESIDTIVRPQMKAKRHDFEIQVHDIKHEDVVVDKLRLNQILLNLLSNAVKYTADGGEIALILEELPQRTAQYAYYRFTVADNGYGMTREYIRNIFQAFTREENSTTNKIQGTGLGMAITKNLVDLMGGSISVTSEKGIGSTFTVELELRVSETTLDHDFWLQNGITRMLAVDDEEIVCQNIQMAMEENGVTADYALSGEEALELVRKSIRDDRPYHIVLIDWKMPGMDGITALRKMKRGITENMPLFVLTSNDWTEIVDEAKEAGADMVLPKPFFVTNFRQKLHEVLHCVEEKTEEESEVSSVLEGMHVLVAEDNEINAEILSELLDMTGATCDIYENGKLAAEAFEQSAPGQYQIVLMDVQMPVMNGYEATRKIRGLKHPLAKTIPIIAMTANAFAEDIQNALASGMNAHVSKPVDMDVLEKVVRELWG